MPGAVLFAPVAGRLPAFRLHRRPAIGQPKRWSLITARFDEFEPFGVRDQMPRNADARDQLIMEGQLVIETKAIAVMTDRVNSRWHLDKPTRALRRARRMPFRMVRRIGRILHKRVENIGD